MQLEKEKKEKRERERCRALAQRIAEEANPASAALLGEQMPLLAKALHSAGVEAEEWTESSEAELLVVADPAWETLPETLPARVLLVSDESTVMVGRAAGSAGILPRFWLAQQGPRSAVGAVLHQPAHPAEDGAGLRDGNGHPA